MRPLRDPPLLIGAAALFSGAALVMAVFWRQPLMVTVVACGSLAAIAFVYRWSQTPPAARLVVKRRAAIGLLAGTLATAGYDLTRWLIVAIADLKYRPFDTLFLFGYSLAGAATSRETALAVGVAYHWCNGVFFAISYCVLLGERNWKVAIVWALALELAMFTVYPTWLDLQAVKTEFTLVSLSGHLVYGVILGTIAERKLAARRTLGERTSRS
jgi:hypothetical protein